jgi:hypothetical protein
VRRAFLFGLRSLRRISVCQALGLNLTEAELRLMDIVWDKGAVRRGDNTGSNPVGDADQESMRYSQFRRNFVGTNRHNFYQPLDLPHRVESR